MLDMSATEQSAVWFIFTKQCFDSVMNVDLHQFMGNDCLLFTVSKLLSYGIIAGSACVKIPQIIKLISTKSTTAISIVGLAFETLGYAIVSCYFYRQYLPISTYGEAPLIFAQNLIVLALIFYYNHSLFNGILLITGYCVFVSFLMSQYVSFYALDLMYSSQIFLILLARLPQIWSIYKAGTTGSISFISRFSRWIGNVARLFTIIQEVDNNKVVLMICISFMFNSIIMLQFFIYRNVGKKKKKE